MDWLTYSILATIFLGFSMVFYKIPAYKNYSGFISTIWTNAISAVLVIIGLLLFSNANLTEGGISWYGILWGAFFAMSMIFYMLLLRGRDAGVIFPVMSSIGNSVTVLIGVIFLSEKLSLIQIFGIVIIILSVYFFSKKKGELVLDTKALWCAVGLIVASTIQKYVQKLGAMNDTIPHFMTYQYIGAAVFAAVLLFIFERDKVKEVHVIKKYWKGAFLIALFSVLGGYAIFKALSLAPLSTVYAIHPSYTFVAAIMGVILFKEKITARKIVLILTSIVGVILLRIG